MIVGIALYDEMNIRENKLCDFLLLPSFRRDPNRGAKLAWQPRSPQKGISICSYIVAILCLPVPSVESWLGEVTAVARFADFAHSGCNEQLPVVETFECGWAGA